MCVQSIFPVEWGDTTHDKPLKWHICAFASELSGRYSSLNPTKRLSTISKWAVHVGFGFAWSPWCWKQKEQKDVVLGWPAFAGFACWRHQIPILEPGFCVGQCPAWNNWLFHPATELSQGIASVCTFHYICSILQVMPTIKQPNFNLCWNRQQVLWRWHFKFHAESRTVEGSFSNAILQVQRNTAKYHQNVLRKLWIFSENRGYPQNCHVSIMFTIKILLQLTSFPIKKLGGSPRLHEFHLFGGLRNRAPQSHAHPGLETPKDFMITYSRIQQIFIFNMYMYYTYVCVYVYQYIYVYIYIWNVCMDT